MYKEVMKFGFLIYTLWKQTFRLLNRRCESSNEGGRWSENDRLRSEIMLSLI